MASVRISAGFGLPNTCVQGVAEFWNVIYTKLIILIYIKPVPEGGMKLDQAFFEGNLIYNFQRVFNVNLKLKIKVNTVTNEICLCPQFHWFKIKMASYQ